MKKFLIISASLMLFAAPAANAQAFLNKMKEKAEQAVGNAIGDKISNTISEKVGGKINETVEQKTGVDLKNPAGKSDKGLTVVSGTDMVQPRHSSSFCWTEAVTPSAASSAVKLLGELPAVPAAAELANPTEATQAAYYRAIKAVTLRAEELNSSATCADDMAELWRDDYEKALVEAFGITPAELKMLESENLTPEQEEALQQKILLRLMGSTSMEQLEADAQKAATMSEQDMMDAALNANFAVYDKYPAEIKKYMGVTVAELKENARQSAAAKDQATQDRLHKELDSKIKAYQKEQKALDKGFEAEANAFGKKFEKELLQATMKSSPGVGAAMSIFQNAQKAEQAFSPLMERQKKLEEYLRAVMAAWPATAGNVKDLGIIETKKLEDIKAKINATNDPKVYNALYQQAGDIIKQYRMKVAESWAADVQGRINKVKEAMPQLVALQKQAVADKLIPECALWRTPLNLVIEAGDVLEEAYADFPNNYPTMFNEEQVMKVQLEKGDAAWWPEFYVASESLNDILAGKNIFKYGADGNYYQLNNGSWTPVPQDFGLGKKTKTADIKSQTWTSQDGKRTVRLDADYGQQLFLPEGDIIYGFAAIEKQGNNIVWANIDTVEENGTTYYKITKCTYKL